MAKSQYTAFPTFGGPKEGGGIMDVKLSPSQMRFPTARRQPNRETIEPDLTEKLAPLLPFLVEGIGGLINRGPEKLTDTEYLDSIGGMVDDPNTLEDVQSNRKAEAQLNAYQLYGEPTERQGFGVRDIVDLLAAGSLGKGGDDYAKSAVNLRNAKEVSRLKKETNRTSFLNTALKEVDNLQYKVFEDVDKARVGVNDYRSGYVDPRGEAYVMKDDKSGYVNIKSIEGNWIEQKYKPTTSLSSQLKDPSLIELNKIDAELNVKDNALIGTLTLTNRMVDMLDKGIADDTQNPLTTVTQIGSFLNDVTTNFQQIGSYIGKGDVLNAFATEDDVYNRTGGSNGREGNGELAKQLYIAIQSGDDNQMQAAMAAFEEGNEGVNFRASLGDMAYNDVRTRAVMLQLAYAAAAANGQTGRTLSDKDLAFHLQMVGFGATQDAQTAKDNILDFMDTLITSTDNIIKGTISENRLSAGRYDLNNKGFTSIIAGYWEPPKVTNDKGKSVPDFTNVSGYQFKNFYNRYGKIEDISRFKKHKRRAGTRANTNPNTLANPSARLQEDLDAINNLY